MLEEVEMFVEEVEICCWKVLEGNWSRDWEEKGRFYRLSFCENEVGRFLRCFVRNGEGKRHNILIPEGKGLVMGWELMVERLGL